MSSAIYGQWAGLALAPLGARGQEGTSRALLLPPLPQGGEGTRRNSAGAALTPSPPWGRGQGRFDRGFVGNHSDTAGKASDLTVGLALAVPPVLDLFVVGANRAFAEDLTVATEAVMVSTLFQQIANFGYQRPRPRTYEGIAANVHGGEGYLSFLAGHVATTTAVLTVAAYTIRQRYGEHVWPWVVAGVVAGSVGAERLLGGYHFPTDVALGAALGLGVGLAVPWLHARHHEVQIGVTPTQGGYGLALLGSF